MTIPLSPLGERFENDAGWIQNLAERPVGGVSVIFCKAGSSRSHHYHLTDSHELYVLSGSMRYVERSTFPKPVDATRHQRLVQAGEMVHTGPGIMHSTYFDEDTLLVSMSKRPRRYEDHEMDVVRCEPLPWDDDAA